MRSASPLLILILLLSLSSSSHGQCETFVDHDELAYGDLFGSSVAIGDDLLVVGSPRTGPLNFGSAVVLRRVGTEWADEAILEPSDPEFAANFGTDVDLDGNHVIVSRPRENPDVSRGSVYVFSHDGVAWSERTRLRPDLAFDEGSGFAERRDTIAISGDVIVVGARKDSEAAFRAGALYVYRFDGSEWIREAKLIASDAVPSLELGFSVAVDGDRIVASTGELLSYVFEYDGVGWTETAVLASPGPAGSDQRVSLSGNRVVIADFGYGGFVSYTLVGASWELEDTLPIVGSRLGWSVDLNGDYVAIGSRNQPLVHLYHFDGLEWVLARDLTPIYAFGSQDICVSLSNDYSAVGVREYDLLGEGSGIVSVFGLDGPDCDGDGVIDYCQIVDSLVEDCNGNGVPDPCDLSAGTSTDLDSNGTPDECQPDCNENGVPDVLDISGGASLDLDGSGVPDECEPDCNRNGVVDAYDILIGDSLDTDENGVPDECQADCDGDGVLDTVAIADGLVADCDGSGVPDSCEIAAGILDDVNRNGIPDGCDLPSAPSELTLIGPFPGGEDSWATDVNVHGAVCGFGDIDVPGGEQQAFMYTDAEGLVRLPPAGDPDGGSMARAINDQGVVVGWQLDFGPKASRYTPGQGWEYIGTLGGSDSRAEDINESGAIVGYSEGNGFVQTGAFAYSDGMGMIALTTDEDFDLEYAHAINERNQLCGNAQIFPGSSDVGFRMMLGEAPVALPHGPSTGSFPDTYAFGMNDHGDVVGITDNAPIWYRDSFGTVELPVPGSGIGHALDIDNSRRVVGWIQGDRAALWINGQVMDLNDAVVNPPGVTLRQAVAISDSGYIAGLGGDDDDWIAFRLRLSDCDEDGLPDLYEFTHGTETDCNENGVQDSCEIAQGVVTDCNGNGLPDSCDIASGLLVDSDGDMIPDVCTPFLRGDVNADGQVDMADPITLAGYLFGLSTVPCLATGEVNGDLQINIADAIYLVSYLYRFGPEPVAPFPSCGAGLGGECGGYDACPQ